MISGVRGTLEQVGSDSVIVTIGGLSIQIFVPISVLHDMDPVGDQIHLYTQLIVKEGSWALYGFSSTESLHLFNLLVGVSGVGPKFGLALLSGFKPDALSIAISSGDTIALTKVPGIGKRTAERIVVELKDKLDPALTVSTVNQSSEYGDANQALLTLGYSQTEIRVALSSITETKSLSLEEQIRLALEYLSSH